MSAVRESVTSAEIESFRVAGDTINLLADSESTQNHYESFEVFASENNGPPPHSHAWSEFYYILEGEIDLTVNGRTTRLSRGSFAHVTPGMVHAHRIASEKARFLFLASPAGVSELFRTLDRETQGSVEDIGKILAIAELHGLKVQVLVD